MHGKILNKKGYTIKNTERKLHDKKITLSPKRYYTNKNNHGNIRKEWYAKVDTWRVYSNKNAQKKHTERKATNGNS